MTSWSRRGAWGLVLVVLVSWAVAFGLAAAGIVPSAGPGEPVQGEASDPQVVLVGIPGLTWDVIDDRSTPTLAALAGEGGAAALVLRGTHEVTCAADAWLTVGAGQRAATDVEGCQDAAVEATPTGDRPAPVLVEEVVQAGAVAADAWDRWRGAADRRSLGTRLGSLAEAAEEGGTCVAAYGDEAVLGAAGPDGAAAVSLGWEDRTVPVPVPQPGQAATGSTTCRLHLVSTPPVAPPGTPAAGPARGQPVGAVPPLSPSEVDAIVADIAAELPEGTTLVVAGLGHTAQRAEAMALIVHPVGGADGASLSSGSTRQEGLVQLTDLAPTLLRLAGVVPPEESAALAGQAVTVAEGSTSDGDHVSVTRDLSAGVSLAKSSVVLALGALAAVVAPLLLLAGLLRRGRAVSVLATVAMAVPVATFLAGLVPWWRTDAPAVVLTLVVAGAAVLVAALGWAGPWRHDRLAPAAVVATVTLVVLGVDMMWSARLGLVSVLGLQPVTAGRFYGQGNVGFGIALGSFLVLAGAVLSWLVQGRDSGTTDGQHGSAEHLSHDGPAEHPTHDGPAEHPTHDGPAEHLPRPGAVAAATAVVLLGGALTVVGAAPWGGADFGGVPALVVGTGLLVMAALGLRWSARRLLGLAVLGVLAAAAVMVLDWLRGPERRTHLGDFVQSTVDGEALGIVTRKLDQSLGILVRYPASWLAVVALVLVALVVVRRPAWSAALWHHPGLYPTYVAGLGAIVLAWALNDSGIAVVALALTMLIAAALTVLGRELSPQRAGRSGGPASTGVAGT